jgi:cyanophycinase
MSKSDTVLIAIGGGELREAEDILQEFLGFLKGKSNGHLVVMTVATNKPEKAAEKYDSLFRKRGVKRISIVDVSERNDAFNESALRKIRESDALFFTGGDQLNVTSLLGGTPLPEQARAQ